ncbi:peptidase [Mesoterricola sediminis]|uniref:Neutral metalloproteinase n=2 Tax=Mesoterricola sediminis TaxID=2927980 RepID=A0AA48GY68_9BACT|nr:peptidase [Mesoterricola sediminis]
MHGFPRMFPLFLLALPLPGQDEAWLASQDRMVMETLKPSLGLASEDTLVVERIIPDPDLQGRSTRFAQYHKGVKVMGGEGVLHVSGARTRGVTDAFVKGLDLDTRPLLPSSEALAAAMEAFAPVERRRVSPTTELLVVRLAGRDALAFRVHLEEEGPEPRHMDYLVDAHTGRILKHWASLRTGRASKGQGRSQHSGLVVLGTTWKDQDEVYELRDWTRGRTGNAVYNLDHGTRGAKGTLYTNQSDVWGDGRNYDGGDTTSPNGETAAVDAAYGLQVTWDYYAQVLGRKGIDGEGRAIAMRVHYGKGYDNAFWSDACFCVSLGDGKDWKALTTVDILGHELSHGVCATTAKLEYFGESGSLNEANSDINGCLIEYYARGGAGDVIGSWGGNWTIGEQVSQADPPEPIRYLYKPSKDGYSPDVWSKDLKNINVHKGSGPMNRAFFFLSQGASPNRQSDYYTNLLPKGMEGIGNDRAARIWYRALTHYLTSLSGYQDARKACVSAAQDLYGQGGAEEKAVWNAFHGVGVGTAWKD